jgi:hypothetical protein
MKIEIRNPRFQSSYYNCGPTNIYDAVIDGEWTTIAIPKDPNKEAHWLHLPYFLRSSWDKENVELQKEVKKAIQEFKDSKFKDNLTTKGKELGELYDQL